MVLILHSTFYLQSRGASSVDLWKPGYYGVHIFFVISGFVMMRCAAHLRHDRRSWATFIRARATRIVPLYWIVTTAKLAVVLVAPVAISGAIDPVYVFSSYLFLPAASPSGDLTPFYGVGWTLQFEALFYVLFAVALWFRRDPLPLVTVALLLLALLSLTKTSGWPPIGFYCDPIVLNFAWGMAICRAVDRGVRLPPIVAAGLLAASMAIILIVPGTPLLGVQFAAVVFATIQLEPIIRPRLPALAVRGGAASYALYLCHPLIGPAIVTACLQFGMGPGVAIAIAWGGSVAGALVVFDRIEKPMSRWMDQRRRSWRAPFATRHERFNR